MVLKYINHNTFSMNVLKQKGEAIISGVLNINFSKRTLPCSKFFKTLKFLENVAKSKLFRSKFSNFKNDLVRFSKISDTSVVHNSRNIQSWVNVLLIRCLFRVLSLKSFCFRRKMEKS